MKVSRKVCNKKMRRPTIVVSQVDHQWPNLIPRQHGRLSTHDEQRTTAKWQILGPRAEEHGGLKFDGGIVGTRDAVGSGCAL